MNSAASCTIVCLLCLFTAFLTGTFGILQKQITACMVTGVMYMLAGMYSFMTWTVVHVNSLKINQEHKPKQRNEIPNLTSKETECYCAFGAQLIVKYHALLDFTLWTAVFCCFTLVIMHTKINYMQEDCYELDPVDLVKTLCEARDVTVRLYTSLLRE